MPQNSQRLFISLNPPVPILAGLATVQHTVRTALAPLPLPTVRWMRADQMHLTLHFLGECPPDRANELESALRDYTAHITIPELALRGLGCFPAFNHPRVIWIGVEENEALQRLHAGSAQLLSRHFDIKPETSFYPHLTLARLGRQQGQDRFRLSSALESIETPCVPWTPRAISLMRSVPSASGANYSCIAQFTPKSG